MQRALPLKLGMGRKAAECARPFCQGARLALACLLHIFLRVMFLDQLYLVAGACACCELQLLQTLLLWRGACALPCTRPEMHSCRLEMAKTLRYLDADCQARHDAVKFVGMEAEVRAVEAAVEGMAPPHAFSHNDLLSGNILVSTLVRSSRDGRAAWVDWHADPLSSNILVSAVVRLSTQGVKLRR